MRNVFPALTALLLFAAPADAQIMVPTTDPFAGHEAADTIPPKTSYPLGRADLVARQMVLGLKLERAQRDLCAELGCLMIINESKSYQVTAFYAQTAGADGTPEWSSNQFGRPLYPKRATWRFKTGGPGTCDVPVRFVLRNPKTKDEIQFDTRTSLCSGPHNDSLVRIRAVVPEVKVDG
ncbi:MAG TPA: hypothetical protein VF079_10755 [Sphingomicrobium sp.]